jgi:hypothetical protein
MKWQEVKSEKKNIERQEHAAKEEDILPSFLEHVRGAHGALDVTEKTEVSATAFSEGAEIICFTLERVQR